MCATRMIVKKNRKGISTFIATLLLMVLAVSAGVVIYAYTMGYLGGFGGPQTMGAISIDAWSLDPAGTPELVAYIRNIGKASFLPDSVYVNGVKLDNVATDWKFGTTTPAYPPTSIGETEVGQLQIFNAGFNFEPSTTYEVKIIGVDNTQLSFQVKK